MSLQKCHDGGEGRDLRAVRGHPGKESVAISLHTNTVRHGRRGNLMLLSGNSPMTFNFSTIPIKIPAIFFYRNWQADPKIHMYMQGTQNSQEQFWKERTNLRELVPTPIMTAKLQYSGQCATGCRPMEGSWGYKYVLIFMVSWLLTGVPWRFNGGKNSLLGKWRWNNWLPTSRRTKLDFDPVCCTKINSKWIKNLNNLSDKGLVSRI